MSTTTELSFGSIEDFTTRLPSPGSVDVTIEVLGADIGDQVQVQRLPWHTLIYDTSSEVLELSVGSRGRSVPVVFRHEIHHPERLWVEEEGGSIKVISIEHADGTQTIVTFHERQALGPGS